jgi:hypothetical protein
MDQNFNPHEGHDCQKITRQRPTKVAYPKPPSSLQVLGGSGNPIPKDFSGFGDLGHVESLGIWEEAARRESRTEEFRWFPKSS